MKKRDPFSTAELYASAKVEQEAKKKRRAEKRAKTPAQVPAHLIREANLFAKRSKKAEPTSEPVAQ